MKILDTRIDEKKGKYHVLVKVPFLLFFHRWLDSIAPFTNRPDAEIWQRIIRRAKAVYFI